MNVLRGLADRARRHPDAADALLAVVLLGVVLPGLWLSQGQAVDGTPHRRPDALGVALVCLALLPAAARRRRPGPVLAVTLAAAVTLQHLEYVDTGRAVGACIAFYTVAAHVPRPRAWWYLGGVLLAVTAALAVEGEKIDAYLGNWLLVAATFALGDSVRSRRAHVLTLEMRALRAERDREDMARRAVIEERARIAREMHDVVAHSISVMVVQAAAARCTRDRDGAEAAMAQIEATGRQALAEMRRVVGVLRHDAPAHSPSARLSPQPGLGELGDLVERMRATGLPVRVEVHGDPRPLAPGLDLAAFRIVQEALTNTRKHAGPASARVVLRYADGELCVQVVDDGRGAAGRLDRAGRSTAHGGHGLVGMRERVAMFGGSLRAGPRRGGGYEVVARLPLEAVPGDVPPARPVPVDAVGTGGG